MKTEKIAITGGIGSGKSAVLSIIKKLGYAVYSCDEIVRELYKEQSVLEKLKALFPDCLYESVIDNEKNLSLDKKKLASRVFNDKCALDKLDALIHPLVIERFFALANKEKGLAFCEVPVLFENGLEKYFDRVIVVMRSKLERIKSVKERSQLTDGEIENRINSQVDYENMDKSKYIVITNDGSVEDLELKVKTVIDSVLKI